MVIRKSLCFKSDVSIFGLREGNRMYGNRLNYSAVELLSLLEEPPWVESLQTDCFLAFMRDGSYLWNLTMTQEMCMK